MKKPFEIIFDFPLADPDFIITLKATAELHHSQPYYVVDDFHLIESKTPMTEASILPPQEIKLIEEGSEKLWVHKDSGRETLLSMALGKAIEKVSGNNNSN
jgi:hypothetical protein